MQTCNNCHQPFNGKYCTHCGQKATVGRLSLHEVFHELVHAFTHAEKGILRLSKELLISPRKMYMSYFSGKRKTYFSPVMIFLLAIGLLIFLGDRLWDLEHSLTNKPYAFERLINRLDKVRYLIFIPLISLLTWLFFYKRFNVAECLTFWFFCLGLVNIFGIISCLPQFLFMKYRHPINYFSDWIVWIIILTHIFIVFFNRTWWSGIKCFILALSMYILLSYISLLLAYSKGLSIDFNFWHVVNVF